MKQITEKEMAVLKSIVDSEYQDGNPVGHMIWLDYVVDSKSRGGVLTSLAKKGWVEFEIVPLNKSNNRQAGISDSTIWITDAGFHRYQQETVEYDESSNTWIG